MYAILEKSNSSKIIQVLKNRGMDDVPVQIVGKGEGPKSLEEAARVPTDILILDIEADPSLGPAVLRYRLKRPDTRIILIAAGKKPGDSDVAAVVQAGVYDVITDISALDAVLDQPPANLSTAAKWLDPAISLEAGGEVSKTIIKEKIIEKKVAMSQRPVLIAVAGTALGVGTTSASLNLAAFLAGQKYKTVYIEAGEPSIEVITGMEVSREPKPFRPRFDVCRDVDYMNIVRMRKHEYIVLDLGAVEPEKLQKTDADLMLAVLPPLSRLARARAWMSAKVPFIAGDEALDAFFRDTGQDVFMLPYKHRFPSGDRKSNEYCSNILRSILPEKRRNKILGFI
ncbi:hypothetical protein [Tepidanaerobacter acetatoxydans]|uniref:hypothetical protein n=1 Tax=Tepidanaerobacter acetatoxydans TaxID=499229 RepID=UPI001BD5EA9B|nr:hypothetical protein [Tepidanaerobacter acetatoxydans]